VRPGQATDPQRAGLAACRPAIDTAFAMRRACIADALMAQWAAFPYSAREASLLLHQLQHTPLLLVQQPH
jgi:hypothetical protein